MAGIFSSLPNTSEHLWPQVVLPLEPGIIRIRLSYHISFVGIRSQHIYLDGRDQEHLFQAYLLYGRYLSVDALVYGQKLIIHQEVHFPQILPHIILLSTTKTSFWQCPVLPQGQTMSLPGKVAWSVCFFLPQPVQQSFGLLVCGDPFHRLCGGVDGVLWPLSCLPGRRHLSSSCSARRSYCRSVAMSPFRNSVRIVLLLKSHCWLHPIHFIFRSHCTVLTWNLMTPGMFRRTALALVWVCTSPWLSPELLAVSHSASRCWSWSAPLWRCWVLARTWSRGSWRCLIPIIHGETRFLHG